MDTRPTFRDRRQPAKDRWGDAARKPGGGPHSKPGEGRPGEANPPGRLPGKAPKDGLGRPYPKPTQVDVMSILRRSGDGLLRN